MQANSAEHQPLDAPNSFLNITTGLIDGNEPAVENSICHEQGLTYFHGQYSSCMEMHADARTVAQYLDAHQEWFHRSAHPMKAESLGENGYALIIGKFGSFGYEVEPKVGLNLLPQGQDGVYRIETIPIPDYVPPGYDVDFQAALELVETEVNGTTLTRVEWELDLNVAIYFPRFIYALPQSLIQSTGDRLLNQIVRQMSRSLTRKVQEDFHSTLNIPFPDKSRRKPLWR